MSLRVRVEARTGDPGELPVSGYPVLVNGIQQGLSSLSFTVDPGQFVTVELVETAGYDLVGRIVGPA